mgnify:CR=1
LLLICFSFSAGYFLPATLLRLSQAEQPQFLRFIFFPESGSLYSQNLR